MVHTAKYSNQLLVNSCETTLKLSTEGNATYVCT